MKGKLILATVHGRNGIPNCDINLLAVGKPKGFFYFKFFRHAPGLAPSRELVTFTKTNNRKGRAEGWFERYTESLLDEWMIRGDSIAALKQLCKWLDEGRNVGVACYCAPQKRNICHLGILASLMQDLGYDVIEAEPIKYK